MSWNYIQHDNAFCTGCHVMGPSFQAFTASEHSELECHDCHRQSIFASTRQLVMWVAERPEDIGTHAHIPDAICQECHATNESETWTYVEQTAGHRVHFEMEDPALDSVACLTCHAPEVHEFVPIDQTCSQAGCHEDMDITLGRMADQTSLHCATCHEFTADVAALATTDSAASALTPAFDGCTGCHEMREMLADFDPEIEPHDARCGVCHDVHEQTEATDAASTCAECHDDWRNEPFHVGEAHADAGSQCVLCHEPHASKVDASDCAACHRRIASDPEVPAPMRQRLRSAQPFDTAAALRETRAPEPVRDDSEPDVVSSVHPEMPASIGLLASAGDPRTDLGLLLAAPADTFEHAEHESLNCINCHTTSEGHGGLTFERPRGCQICHHRAPARAECADCHPSASELPAHRADVTVRPVPDAEPVHRTGDFAHETHADLACVDCHQQPVSLAPTADVASCASCHEEHHAAEISCAGCHSGYSATTPEPGVEQVTHAPPVTAHEACAACHTPATIAGMQPDRPFCLTCHQDSADHEPDGQCTTCHLLETPDEYRPRLVEGDRSGS